MNKETLLFLLMAFTAAGRLNAFAATLLPATENTTGRLIYTDDWGRSPVREVDTRNHVNLLGTTLALGAEGTNLEVRLMLAIISHGTNDYPRDFKGSISVQVRSSTNESSLKNVLGQVDYGVVVNPAQAASSPIKAVKHSAEMLGNRRALFVYELYINIPFQKKVGVIPEYVSIISGMYNELDIWKYTRMPWKSPNGTVSPIPVSPPIASGQNKNAETPGRESRQPRSDPPSASTAAKTFPEIRVSITREADYLLITCSPVVEGSELEQADLTNSPLAWRPLQNGAKEGSRWFVPPSDGARAFRVKLPR